MALIFIGFCALFGGALSLTAAAIFGSFAVVLAPFLASAFAGLAGLRLFWQESSSVPRLSRAVQTALGARLRSAYAGIVEQPLPEHMSALALRLA